MRRRTSSEGNQERDHSPEAKVSTPDVKHIPVLLPEAVDLLAPKPGGVYVDGTLGAGGHATEILKRSAPDGVLIGLDRDAEAVERGSARLTPFGRRIVVRQANYRDLPTVLSDLGYDSVDGVLLDLGVSWFHLKSPERGFSFMIDGPLDMRMDRDGPTTAADLVRTLPREELARIIREYGEESKSWAIAGAIVKERVREPITRTAHLARIVSSVFPPSRSRRIHPATLTFQALRIAVNDEMGSLREGLDRIIPVIRAGGRLVVISFHSLEDRIVKQAFAAGAKGCVCPPKLPVCACGKKKVLKVLTHRPITADETETEHNPAARSAKLRASEKL